VSTPAKTFPGASHVLLTLQGGGSLRGTVRVPGDKSISHRALLFGAIAEGETVIEGLLPAEDPLSTAACLRAMGVVISPIEAGLPVSVQGVGLDGFQEPGDVLDCGNSGTTMRLMLGLDRGDGHWLQTNGDLVGGLAKIADALGLPFGEPMGMYCPGVDIFEQVYAGP